MDTSYTIYQTTNLVNGKIYIGMHETEDPNDAYLGSGKLLKQAIKKHGRENFEKSVLHIFKTREEMVIEESKNVNEDFVARNDTYNLITGGTGFSSEDARKYMKLRIQNGYRSPILKGSNHPFYGKTFDEIHGKKLSTKIRKIQSKSTKQEHLRNPRTKNKNANAKTLEFTDPSGNQYIVSGSLRKFCKQHKLNTGLIIDAAKGRRQSYKGWTVNYICLFVATTFAGS